MTANCEMTATASFKNVRMVLAKVFQHFLQMFMLVTLTLSACCAATESPHYQITSLAQRSDAGQRGSTTSPDSLTPPGQPSPRVLPNPTDIPIPLRNPGSTQCIGGNILQRCLPSIPPTTRPPTTRPPTTCPPTTRPPTTRPPTTRPPTTRPPTRPPPQDSVCEAKSERLVHYPTTLAPASGSVTVTTQCADNAHRTSSTLSVSCISSGNWSGTTPQCQCDTGYRAVTVGGRQIYQTQATTTCPARNEGLVRYPTTLSPLSGSVTVTTQCADNAHILDTASLNVTCTSNGSWSGQIPQCQCDEGYQSINISGKQMCEGVRLRPVQDSTDTSTVISTSVISFLLILSLTAVISIIIICGMKLRNKTSDDIESGKISAPHARVEKQKDGIKKEDVPVTSNKAYAIHNVSRCIKVSTNETYAVSEVKRNDEPVYELVK